MNHEVVRVAEVALPKDNIREVVRGDVVLQVLEDCWRSFNGNDSALRADYSGRGGRKYSHVRPDIDERRSRVQDSQQQAERLPFVFAVDEQMKGNWLP